MGSFFSSPQQSTNTSTSSGLRDLRNASGGFLVNDVARRAPGDFDYLIDSLKNRAANPFSTPDMQLNSMGLQAPQMQAFNQAVGDAGTRFSAGLMQRGQWSPDNVMNVAGQAAMNTAPQFMDTISNNLMEQFKRKYLLPEDVANNRFAQLLQGIQMGQGYLGQQSNTVGRQTGAGIGYTLGNEFAGALGSAAGKSAAGGISGMLGA